MKVSAPARKKVLFVQPTIYDDRDRPVKKGKLYFIGLAYPVLAALLPPDWEAEICLETIEDVPFDTDACLVGIGGMGHAARRSVDLAKEFRARGKIVIMGGPMATLVPELAEKYFDVVVEGDAEETWPELVADFEAGSLKRRYKGVPARFTRPIPRYDLLLKKKIGDFLPVQAGRGCPETCSFCSIHCMYRGRYQRRDIEEVLRDIREVKRLGFRKFLLIDDNIVSEPEYMRELCAEIAKLGMEWMSQCSIELARDEELLATVAAAGCYALSFGLESVNPESLRHINKGWADPADYPEIIRKVVGAGIEVASEMIVGIDTDTKESLLSTVDFVLGSDLVAPKFYVMTPIPGTDFYREMKEAGRIVEPDVFRFSPSRAVITHPSIATEELSELYWEIYRRVYTLPRILRRTILKRRFLAHPSRGLFFLGLNLYYRYQIRRRIAPNIM